MCRDARTHTGWGDTQLKLDLRRLVELEYLVVHRDRDAGRFLYELLPVETATGGKVLAGLIAADELRGDRAGCGRGLVGPRSGCGRPAQTEGSAGDSRPQSSLNGKPADHGHGA